MRTTGTANGGRCAVHGHPESKPCPPPSARTRDGLRTELAAEGGALHAGQVALQGRGSGSKRSLIASWASCGRRRGAAACCTRMLPSCCRIKAVEQAARPSPTCSAHHARQCSKPHLLGVVSRQVEVADGRALRGPAEGAGAAEQARGAGDDMKVQRECALQLRPVRVLRFLQRSAFHTASWDRSQPSAV